MLRFDTVTIPAAYEPPRPTIEPKRRAQVLHAEIGDLPEYLEDWGLRASRRVRFVSSARQGFVNSTMRDSLVGLYEAGAAFALETDLLSPLGTAAATHVARFDPETAPTFAPATPGGALHYMDITLLILETEGS